MPNTNGNSENGACYYLIKHIYDNYNYAIAHYISLEFHDAECSYFITDIKLID